MTLKHWRQKIRLRLHRLWRQFTVSADLKAKLRHNYHALTWLEKLLYWSWYRRRLSHQERWFFEGERGLAGQMYIADRRALYHAVIRWQPDLCLEIGTWTGGGSTFFLASALADLGRGKLLTSEIDPGLCRQAQAYYRYRLPHLAKRTVFLNRGDLNAFTPYLEKKSGIVAYFLDGAEDSAETVRQYEFFRPFFQPGAILMAHDWHTDKMAGLKPILLSDPHWQLIEQLDPPASIGFVVFQRI